jgi:DMSO/TMAO reductase YedYZ molybdopterin-dependent catalytic subunit
MSWACERKHVTNPTSHMFEGVAGNSNASLFGKENEVKKVLYSLLLGVIMVMLGCSPAAETAVETPTEAPVATTVLELVKDDTSIALSMDEIKALPSVEGLGGIMSSTGKITAPALYKGVLISTLLDELGGLSEDRSVEIIAEDGYSLTYSSNQIINGEYITYDVSSGDEIDTIGSLQTIIAYEREGEPLNVESEGQLRLVIIGESQMQVVDGHWSVKWVNKIVLKEAVEDWTVDFIGAIDEPMDRATFESGAAEGCHMETWTDEDGQEWTGIPLFYLLGRVDDEVKHGDDAYRDDLAKAGYTIDITSSDGYTVTLDSSLVTRNDNIIVAYLVDGNPLAGEDFPLRLVGAELTGKEMVGGIASVVINFPEAEESTEEPTEEPEAEVPTGEAPAVAGPADATLTIKGLVDAEKTLTMADLTGMEVLNISVEHPKKGAMDVTGVRMADVLALLTIKPEASTVSLIASDGFSADVPLADLLACENCLAGWDEEMLRTYMPGFDSNLWVKDLVTIEIK